MIPKGIWQSIPKPTLFGSIKTITLNLLTGFSGICHWSISKWYVTIFWLAGFRNFLLTSYNGRLGLISHILFPPIPSFNTSQHNYISNLIMLIIYFYVIFTQILYTTKPNCVMMAATTLVFLDVNNCLFYFLCLVFSVPIINLLFSVSCLFTLLESFLALYPLPPREILIFCYQYFSLCEQFLILLSLIYNSFFLFHGCWI